ncbi:TonB-dependent siderophore receptor [Comamonas thiooxydans]|uniref:TonB-dependent siderophore receptor n=1 Tax=Comamonas thiooxydans TaxID=363952 RepID=A0AA42Q686_9BURK|nr:TonB-dependent siderophore receptor [Comamonas thiooxydans]MDH1335513.1 TonB-dependent siderophore receptor [Comamonas thiooxydans]MDH1741456.1 TonB-dependent siderophore receptor [Comamonas thiooxydans]MDH1787980.1 TonB-dependent siderophore receptor [Comamonas thiooxydans]
MSNNHLTPTDSNGLRCELKQIVIAAGLCLIGASAMAQQETTLSTVNVEASADASFKTEASPQGKFTAPLLDTPKTVQVINEEIIKQTGATSLQDALRSTPGITFGNGEGGNPTGDQPFIRGMDAQSSTFVDGMRDIAAGTRELFNVEAVEVIKGADSAYAGRGGAGGSINITTKKAKNENFISGDVGLGTDNYLRGTLDINRKINETTGIRLNAMGHSADVPGRNGPDNKRWGIAPTVTFGMGTPTEVTLSWQHLQTDSMPDGGVPYLYRSSTASSFNGNKTTPDATSLPGGSTVRPSYGSNRSNWYGMNNRDYQKEKSDLFTASIEHKFTDTNKIRNSLRYSKSKQDYVWTQPDDSKGNVLAGYVWRRGNFRFSDVETLQNVTEFTGKEQTGSVGHSYAFGLELSKEKSDAYSGAIQDGKTANCTTSNMWCTPLNSPDASTPWNYAWDKGRSTRNKIDTIALYGFDTLKFNEQWLLNAGLRVDHYKTSSYAPEYTNPLTAAKSDLLDQSRSDTLFNYQLGLVYKPAANGSIYANIGTSSRPGGSSLGNGSEDLAITSDALASLKPEKTKSIELGTKWDLLNKKLNLSAAVFRNEVTNVRITENGITYMGGNKEVNGLELGFTGQILSNLSVFGGYTYMDSEQKNMGIGNIANGLPFTNTPKHSFSLWTSYKPMPKLTLGLGVYAQSSVNASYVKSSVDGGIVTKGAGGYTRFDAMMAYQIDKNLAFQLNVFNLGDKVYYSGVRSPHYATMAAGRSAVASLKFTY